MTTCRNPLSKYMVISKNISSKFGDFVLFFCLAKILCKNHIGFLFGSQSAKIWPKKNNKFLKKYLESISLIFKYLIGSTFNFNFNYLGSVLLHIISDDEMTKKKKGFTFEDFVIFRYIYDPNCTKYPIIIKGRFNQPPLFNSLKFWKQLGWINIKSAK